MMKPIVLALAGALLIPSGPSLAASKKATDCGHQAAVVGAVQKARIDRVKERQVPEHVAALATWPESYNTAIPLVTPWVYEMKMRDVKKQDLAAAWNELCLAQ
ncbi:MAG: hypothetical protein WA790_08795 [Sulfitobacter sp.]